MRYLYLYKNLLVGTIPSTASNLRELVQLDLAENGLTGPIPASLSDLRNLNLIYLFQNALSGTIPASFGTLTNLKSLDISETKLTGRVPDSLGSLAQLTQLYLFDNKLSGTIPSALGQLNQLQLLGLNGNHLTGPIPESLMQLLALQQLDLNGNHINSTIPATIGHLTDLQYLLLSGTHITGTLPSSVGQLRNLLELTIQGCHLSGTLPASLGNVLTLQELQLGQNYLTGSVPLSISNLTQLTLLSIPSNHLTGPVPDISRMHSLQFYWLFDNFLTGTIPSTPGALPLSLVSFELFENLMTGTFPDQIGNLSQLFEFNNFENYFSGTLPASLGRLSSSLQYIEVYNNHLTGTLPSSFASLTMLTTLLVENNHLSGEISDMFNATAQTLLFTIQVGGNILQGTLPSSVFSLPLLNSFSAVGNCFGGSLPDNICTATALSVLLLDGASSGCTKRAFAAQAHGMQGTIPSCLLHMPHMQVLHLSSNGFTGSLPVDLPVGPSLYDLALDHNRLTGFIPTTLQNRTWQYLDVSFNKLTGTLEGSFANQSANSSVFVNNNRLSGTVPATLLDVMRVDILAGNLFACKVIHTSDRNDLPEHDEEVRHYQCGSNSFDVPYYVWLSLAVIGAVLCAVIIQCKGKSLESLHRARQTVHNQFEIWSAVWRCNASDGEELIPRVKQVFSIHAIITAVSVVATGYILCVLLPVYLALGASFATHTHEYAYTASAAFLTGTTAGMIEFAFFSLFALLLFAGFYLKLNKDKGTPSAALDIVMVSTNNASSGFNHPTPARRRFVEQIAVWSLFISLNLAVVLGANIGFLVASTSTSIHSNVVTFLQVMLAVFKLTWKWFCGHLIRWVSSYCAAPSSTTSAEVKRANTDTERIADFASLQVFITLVNNIAIPCVVAAVASPNCFYNYFYKTAKIEVVIDFPFCTSFSGTTCTTYSTSTTDVTYQPPFTYGYQRSSSLLTYYAPSFLISCLLVTFVFPLGQALLNYLCGTLPDGTFWHKVLSAWVPRILRPIDAAGAESLQPNPSRPHFDAYQFMIAQLSQLGILLTFGVVFPPLGVAIACTLTFVQYYTQFIVARFVRGAKDKSVFRYITVLEAECAPAESFVPMLHSSMWMLLFFNCSFCALFVFDILGDKVGFNGAVWVLIVLPLFPLLLYGVTICARYVYRKDKNEKPDGARGIELSSVVQSPMAIDAL